MESFRNEAILHMADQLGVDYQDLNSDEREARLKQIENELTRMHHASYNAGYDAGAVEGANGGYSIGYADGESSAYDEGYLDARTEIEEDREGIAIDSYQAGYAWGYEDGSKAAAVTA